MDDEKQELLDTIENAQEELAKLERMVRADEKPKIEKVANIVLAIWKAMDSAE